MLRRTTHMAILYVNTRVMIQIKRAKRLSQALVHFVTARASLFKDQRTSSRPIPDHEQAFQDYLWAYFGHVFDRFQFFLFEVMVVQAWSRDFVQLFSLFLCQFIIFFPRISSHDLPCHKTKLLCSREVSPTQVIF